MPFDQIISIFKKTNFQMILFYCGDNLSNQVECRLQMKSIFTYRPVGYYVANSCCLLSDAHIWNWIYQLIIVWKKRDFGLHFRYETHDIQPVNIVLKSVNVFSLKSVNSFVFESWIPNGSCLVSGVFPWRVFEFWMIIGLSSQSENSHYFVGAK